MENPIPISQDKSHEKKKVSWVTPELVELDIDKETKGNTAGPATFDGGMFISDYTS